MNGSTHSFLSLRLMSALLFAIILGNLLVLNFLVFRYKSQQSSQLNAFLPLSKDTTSFPTDNTSACKKDCVMEIYEAIHQATASLTLSKPAPKTITMEKSSENSKGTLIKEIYVAFGSGTNSSNEWMDVPGLQAYLDSTKYEQIKKVVFEAALLIPTGNERAYARLYNVTDKHPVWFSEISLEGGEPQLLTSQPITLDTGNKLYQVQMKTSLKYNATITQARLRIDVE